MSKPYREAKLYSTGKKWYVYFFYQHPETGKFQRFKEYFEINRQPEKDKLLYGREMVKFFNEQLADGFNPFLQRRTGKAANVHTLLHHLDRIVAELDLTASETTKSTYRLMKSRFVDYLHSAGKTQIPYSAVGVDLVIGFRTWLQQQNLAPKTINSTLSHLGLFTDVAIEKKLLEVNAFRTVRRVSRQSGKKTEDVFEPITFAEMEKIFGYLRKTDQLNFIRYLAMIYYAWVRPVEITRLRVADIDLQSDIIFFRKENTKNDKGAQVQIVPPLKKLLQQLNLEKYPPTHYLFSSPNYLPGIKPIKSKNAGEMWHVRVSKLGISKTMYALKHTGNIEYLLNNKGNVDIKWQQMQNRHSSAAITERYNRKLGAYFIELANLKFRLL